MVQDALKAASEQWLKEANERTLRPVVERLCHYTSGEGLRGIVETGSMWGTNFAFLNDRSEFSYGLNLFRAAIIGAVEQSKDPTLKAALRIAHYLLDSPPCDLYLTCFCEEPDLLSQWRGYGAPGTRYCIEFDAASIPTANLVSPMGPVIYDRSVHVDLLKRMLDIYVSSLRNFHVTTDDDVKNIASAVAVSGLPVIVRFKDPAFREEHEWRCVFLDWGSDPGSIEFANSQGGLRPYRVLVRAKGALPIVRVIAGAARSDLQAVRSARLLLDRFGYRDVPVEASVVPLHA